MGKKVGRGLSPLWGWRGRLKDFKGKHLVKTPSAEGEEPLVGIGVPKVGVLKRRVETSKKSQRRRLGKKVTGKNGV